MKTALITILFILALPVLSQCDLVERGETMFYDTDTNLTWVRDANLPKTLGFVSTHPYSVQYGLYNYGLMGWSEAENWVENLSYGGYDDWRLPNGLHPDSTIAMNYDAVDTEYGHLYYSEGVSLGHPNGFYNLQAPSPRPDITATYWTGSVDPRMPTSNAFSWWWTVGANISDGGLDGNNGGYNWIMICRDGDVLRAEPISEPVPEPKTIWLVMLGLLIGLTTKGKRKNEKTSFHGNN